MKVRFEFDKVSRAGDIQDKVLAKMRKVEKYLRRVPEDLRQGFVRLARGERWGYGVKLGVKIGSEEVVAEAKEKTLLTALDKTYGKLAREVRKRMARLKGGR